MQLLHRLPESLRYNQTKNHMGSTKIMRHRGKNGNTTTEDI